MQRIKDQNPLSGKILSGNTGTRMAMMTIHSFLNSSIIPWCVHGCRTPAFDFVSSGWGAKWRMVNPPVSPEEDAITVMEDLSRLPEWSSKTLKKLLPSTRTSLLMPKIAGEFVIIEAATESLDLDSSAAVLETAWRSLDAGLTVVIYTQDLKLPSLFPESVLFMGLPGRRPSEDSVLLKDHAIWFTALGASRIYTVTPGNNLFSVHFGLAGVPREIILTT